MNPYSSITNYISFIQYQYNLDICINDFAGFLYVDKDLAYILEPYLIHKNPYCLEIKSNKKLFQRCLHMKKGIMIKCLREKKCFYGMSYCGIEEYIIPIICKDVVIGVIYAGEFSSKKDIANYKLEKISKHYNMDLNTLKHKFTISTHEKEYNLKNIFDMLGILAQFISNIYSSIAATHKELPLDKKISISSESNILSHAIVYIKQNYQNEVTAQKLAMFCHCSISHISHIFKKNMKMNIKSYINKVRIEHSKVLLIDSDLSISEISYEVGFKDPNYFSNVFRTLCNTTPTTFRKSFL